MDPLFDGADPLNPQLGDHGVLASATLADLWAIGIPPSNGQAEPVDIVNHLVNFGWEYVFHCHILSHEEMDMMQPVSVAYPPVAPSGLTYDSVAGTLTWTDNSIAETAYSVQMWDNVDNTWIEVDRVDRVLGDPNTTGGTENVNIGAGLTAGQFQVVAENTVGDTFDYANQNINELGTAAAPGTGFPHVTTTSSSDVLTLGEPAPAAPTDLTATLDETVPQVNLSWTDNATNETEYVVERSDNGGTFALIATLNADSMSYDDTTVASGNHYEYQVAAVNAGGASYSNIAVVDWTGAAPAAPNNLAATVLSATEVQLDWTDNAINETGYIVERSDNGEAFAVIANLGPDVVSYSDLTVSNGNSYTYQVAATNDAGQSPYSNQASVSITVPVAPINLLATNVSRTGFTFNWEYPFPQPDGFEIQIATNNNFNSIVQSFPDVNADQTSLVISGLSRNTRYYVRIRGFSAVGVGPWSEILQVRTSK